MASHDFHSLQHVIAGAVDNEGKEQLELSEQTTADCCFAHDMRLRWSILLSLSVIEQHYAHERGRSSLASGRKLHRDCAGTLTPRKDAWLKCVCSFL